MGHDNRPNMGHNGLDAATSGASDGPGGQFDGVDLLDIALGDLMRGERATLGKSLLDVERELKIRAAYVAAIENGDVGAFASQGFIAGYVRSYARYLGMDPEWTFRRFCEETGFQGVHGQQAQQAQQVKRSFGDIPQRRLDPNDVIAGARISFAPQRDSVFSGIEPGALGSIAVLIALVMGLGYGAYAVLTDIQRLQIAPVDQAPAPLAQLDPLAGATEGAFDVAQDFDIEVPGPDTLERLYRPTVLETPVLTPRDGALAAIDPDSAGALAAEPVRQAPRLAPSLAPGLAQSLGGGAGAAEPEVEEPEAPTVQVTEARPSGEIIVFVTQTSWMRVRTASGATLYQGEMQRGESFTLPSTEQPPDFRSGDPGVVYFMVDGVVVGPAGDRGIPSNISELTVAALIEQLPVVDGALEPDVPVVAQLVLEGQSDQ